MKHTVLLGDPSFFRIKGGQNPYTRNRWGFRKRVNLNRANNQWGRLRDTLESLGAQIVVLPAQKNFPGTVFTANAGFLYPKYTQTSNQKRFYLSNLASHRKGESNIYRSVLTKLGFELKSLPYSFEGEADFFPCGDFYIFCHGKIVPTGFRPSWGFPPYRYQFSHRTDQRNLKSLEEVVTPVPIIQVKLTQPKYYHGDTSLFAFGPHREYLLCYLDAIDPDSQTRLKKFLGKRLIPLNRPDAENFVANSFQLDTPQGPHLLLPQGVSEEVARRVSSQGYAYTRVDVSEFFSKGGGSIKCLICDLGPLQTPHL